jgi:hypothetical protein
MYREEKVPEPDRQREGFPLDGCYKNEWRNRRFLPKRARCFFCVAACAFAPHDYDLDQQNGRAEIGQEFLWRT